MAGLLYAQGLSPHAIEQLGYDLYTGRVDLALRPSKLQFLRHLVRDALLPSLGTSGAGFVDCADGLSRMLERYCGAIEPRIPFYCIAFNLLHCRAEVLTPDAVPAHLETFMVQTRRARRRSRRRACRSCSCRAWCRGSGTRRTTSTARRPRTSRCTRSCASGISTAQRASRRASDW
jgi:hypothetical protein